MHVDKWGGLTWQFESVSLTTTMHRQVSLKDLISGNICTCTMCTVPEESWRYLGLTPFQPLNDSNMPELISLAKILKGMYIFFSGFYGAYRLYIVTDPIEIRIFLEMQKLKTTK